jgi:hypothetical protein
MRRAPDASVRADNAATDGKLHFRQDTNYNNIEQYGG